MIYKVRRLQHGENHYRICELHFDATTIDLGCLDKQECESLICDLQGLIEDLTIAEDRQ